MSFWTKWGPWLTQREAKLPAFDSVSPPMIKIWLPQLIVCPVGIDTYSRFVFDKTLVVSAQGGHKHEAMDAFETMNPLLAFWALTTNIKHMITQLSKLKESLCDTCCSKSRSKNVLIVGDIVSRKQAVNIRIVAWRSQHVSEIIIMVRSLLQIIMEGVFVAPFYSIMYSVIGPKPFHSSKILHWERLIYSNILGRSYDTLTCLIN